MRCAATESLLQYRQNDCSKLFLHPQNEMNFSLMKLNNVVWTEFELIFVFYLV